MSPIKTFTSRPKSEPQFFANWLRRYTFKYPLPILEEPQSEIGDYPYTFFSKAKPIKYDNQFSEIFMAIIKHHVYGAQRLTGDLQNHPTLKLLLEEEDEDINPVRLDRISVENIAVLFEIMPLSSRQIEVNIQCFDNRIMDYLEDLSKEINRLFTPEQPKNNTPLQDSTLQMPKDLIDKERIEAIIKDLWPTHSAGDIAKYISANVYQIDGNTAYKIGIRKLKLPPKRNQAKNG